MHMSATTVRRGLYGMFAGGLLAFGSAAIVMPVANAVPDSCSQAASPPPQARYPRAQRRTWRRIRRPTRS
jgi:hypothetical protein